MKNDVNMNTISTIIPIENNKGKKKIACPSVK
jgi:hypothetical protein